MPDAPRISPDRARRAIAENDALLVCAYDDRKKCEKLHIDDAISYPDFRQYLNRVERDRELIFYCT